MLEKVTHLPSFCKTLCHGYPVVVGMAHLGPFFPTVGCVADGDLIMQEIWATCYLCGHGVNGDSMNGECVFKVSRPCKTYFNTSTGCGVTPVSQRKRGGVHT